MGITLNTRPGKTEDGKPDQRPVSRGRCVFVLAILTVIVVPSVLDICYQVEH
jgi:hypothetical protein